MTQGFALRCVDIVNRRVDVVAWQSAHGATNRATVVHSGFDPPANLIHADRIR